MFVEFTYFSTEMLLRRVFICLLLFIDFFGKSDGFTLREKCRKNYGVYFMYDNDWMGMHYCQLNNYK